MRIKQITSQYRNDYTADMACEHCGHMQVDKWGYNDAYYHGYVIPKMHCETCGKNRAGEVKEPT